MDAARAFEHEMSLLSFEPDPKLFRELHRACMLPYRNEPVLMERLSHGTEVLDARKRPYSLLDPVWQRWMTILVAWYVCGQAVQAAKEMPDTTNVAQGATSGLRSIELRPESILGKAKR